MRQNFEMCIFLNAMVLLKLFFWFYQCVKTKYKTNKQTRYMFWVNVTENGGQDFVHFDSCFQLHVMKTSNWSTTAK